MPLFEVPGEHLTPASLKGWNFLGEMCSRRSKDCFQEVVTSGRAEEWEETRGPEEKLRTEEEQVARAGQSSEANLRRE